MLPSRIMAKKPLEPLIPLEQFKKLVAAISRVPKDAVDKAQSELPPGSKRKSKQPTKSFSAGLTVTTGS